MPQPRVKAEPVKKFATTQAKEPGISTSIGARADDSTTNFDFIIVISKKTSLSNLHAFKLLKNTLKKE